MPYIGFVRQKISPNMKARREASTLAVIRLFHTVMWAILAGCIVGLPIVALMDRLDWAAVLTSVVIVECGVLLLNEGRCPVTSLAARYTEDRAHNFDIYLPSWLALRNKAIFGSLFICGECVVLWRVLSG
jgi:hypothetical protein